MRRTPSTTTSARSRCGSRPADEHARGSSTTPGSSSTPAEASARARSSRRPPRPSRIGTSTEAPGRRTPSSCGRPLLHTVSARGEARSPSALRAQATARAAGNTARSRFESSDARSVAPARPIRAAQGDRRILRGLDDADERPGSPPVAADDLDLVSGMRQSLAAVARAALDEIRAAARADEQDAERRLRHGRTSAPVTCRRRSPSSG